MATTKLRLADVTSAIPGGRKPADPAAASALLSAYVGTSVHVLRAYADYTEAERDRGILHAANLDARVSLGVGGAALFVLLVPVGDAVEAHIAFEQASRRASDRPALPTHRQPAPQYPDGGEGHELMAGPGVPPRRRRKTFKTRGSALHAVLGAAGIEDHYQFASSVLGVELTSLSGLSAAECARVTRAVMDARPLAPARREAA